VACTIECNGTKAQSCPPGTTCDGVCPAKTTGGGPDAGAHADADRGKP
jgi:hypothetical protein